MSTTQHPLTEAAAVEMWDASPCPEGYEFRGMLTVEQDATLYAMRAAFDAGRDHERAANPAADADRPWEPLNGRRVYVGDEVRQERAGITITGVVVRVDKDGDPWAADGIFIGEVNEGTWYVRRHTPELPTGLGAVIVAKEEGGSIEATVLGVVWRAREAVFGAGGRWHGVWRSTSGAISYAEPDQITPGTWQEAGK